MMNLHICSYFFQRTSHNAHQVSNYPWFWFPFLNGKCGTLIKGPWQKTHLFSCLCSYSPFLDHLIFPPTPSCLSSIPQSYQSYIHTYLSKIPFPSTTRGGDRSMVPHHEYNNSWDKQGKIVHWNGPHSHLLFKQTSSLQVCLYYFFSRLQDPFKYSRLMTPFHWLSLS